MFHDLTDDGINQARWAITSIQIRHATLDTVHADAWSIPTSNPYTSQLTVNQTGEMVFAFTDKDYIRLLTSNAPFTDDWNVQVPSCVSCAIQFGAHATGQGSGVVTYSATLNAGDLVDPHPAETIMVGLAPSGGSPAIITTLQSFVQNNPYAGFPEPGNPQPGDILLVAVFERQGNGIGNIVAPSGLLLLARSPHRDEDPNAGGNDQYIYMKTYS